MKVGDAIYLRPQGNAARYSKEIKKAIIKKIGRKYFEVDRPQGRFFISDLMHDGGGYFSSWKGYLSPKDAEDSAEEEEIIKELTLFFNKKITLSLKKLREISAILRQDNADPLKD